MVADTGGTRVAVLRKARGLTQLALARRAGVSMSLLSKIEVGDRALTSQTAAELRTAVCRYGIPDQTALVEPERLRGELDRAITLRERAELE